LSKSLIEIPATPIANKPMVNNITASILLKI